MEDVTINPILGTEEVPHEEHAVNAPIGVPGPTVSRLKEAFLEYCEIERRYSKQTVGLYGYYLDRITRILGDIDPGLIRSREILRIKESVLDGRRGQRQLRNILVGLRAFLSYCSEVHGINVLPGSEIRYPRIPRREVEFLSAEEIQIFLDAIPLTDGHGINLQWLMFRAFAEVLLGSGMRLSEALSVRREAVDFAAREARIIGKGDKERTVFFSRQALLWLKEYLNRRTDCRQELFLMHPNPRPVRSADIQKLFIKLRKIPGVPKNVTAHLLRHTVATHLILNGCPMTHVMQILGHELLTTTCRHYIGVDKSAAKHAHQRYLQIQDRTQ
jgi:site-specific recombinase XerD